jgi:hypothetical protein
MRVGGEYEMRADELIVISVGEYEELKQRAKAASGEMFSAEEMQAIREQYVERIEAAEARRDELEFKMRVELAKIRDAELATRRVADGIRSIEMTLSALLSDDEDATQVRPAGPSHGLKAVVPRPQAKVSPPPPPKPVAPPALPPTPPLPATPVTSNGASQAEKFRLAMAHRKRYSA